MFRHFLGRALRLGQARGIFLENDYWTPPGPPPINFVQRSAQKVAELTYAVAAALGLLAAPLGPESVIT